MDIEQLFKTIAVIMWLISTVYFCHSTVAAKNKYIQEYTKLLLYKHSLNEHDSSEVEASRRFLEEHKYYQKPISALLLISCGWGIMVGAGTYAAGWGIYFIVKRRISGFSDAEQTSF